MCETSDKIRVKNGTIFDLTPKERTEELLDKYSNHSFHPSPLFNTSDNGGHTKKCALIAVDLLLSHMINYGINNDAYEINVKGYWTVVKQEITLSKSYRD